MSHINKKEFIKKKDILSWWKNSGESIKKGKSDYRTPVDVEEPEIEREEPERGELYRRLQKVQDLYNKIVVGISPILRRNLVYDEKKYLSLIRRLEDHVNNKIKQEPKTNKIYIQIGDLVKFYGDVDTYNEYFKDTQNIMNKVLKAIAKELNQVALGDSPEKEGNTVLLGMKENENWLDTFKKLIESASLATLDNNDKLLNYVNEELKKLKVDSNTRYRYLEWVQGNYIINEDWPTGTDIAYKTHSTKRPSIGAFPYTPDDYSEDFSDDEKDRISYAFNDKVSNDLNINDELDQILKIHNMQSEVTEEEREWMMEVREATGYEPIVIGSKALGTALEEGPSDLDVFIGVTDESEFERVSQILAQMLSPSKYNDQPGRHPQNRIFNAEDQTKQVGIGYGQDAENFVESIINANLKLDDQKRKKIKDAKKAALDAEDAVHASYKSFKDAIDILLDVDRMVPPETEGLGEQRIVEFGTGVHGGQEASNVWSLPPEQQGKRKVHWDEEPADGKEIKRSDAIDASDIHKRPAAQNTQAKMTGDNARRNNATGFVNQYIQRGKSQEDKQKIAGRAINFSNTEDMDFTGIDQDSVAEPEKEFEENVDNSNENNVSINTKEVVNKMKEFLPGLNLDTINKKYEINPKLKYSDHPDLKAHYDFDKDIIYINPESAEGHEDFLQSYLHELNHALKSRELGGPDALQKSYEMEISKFQAAHPGEEDNWYPNHPYEREAEAFAHAELGEWVEEV